MLVFICCTNLLIYQSKPNDFKTNKKKYYDRKIWLFGFCEALACVSGKRQCAKCAKAFFNSFFGLT